MKNLYRYDIILENKKINFENSDFQKNLQWNHVSEKYLQILSKTTKKAILGT
jgi:hypothetical protein